MDKHLPSSEDRARRIPAHHLCGPLLRCFSLWVLAAALGTAHAANPKYRAIAEYFAPVVYQETHSVKLDQIARFDFDGDWNGANNWENAYLYPTPAFAYYAVIEAERHYFLTYAFYHCRDYTDTPMEGFAPKTEHENDMEGIMLVVRKDERGQGEIIAMETLAHDHFYRYAADFEVNRDSPLDGTISWRSSPLEGESRKRPSIFIESQGHGIYNLDSKYDGKPEDFPGIIYRPAGREAEEPRNAEDHNVSYALISLQEALWVRRDRIGSDQTYCCSELYALSGRRRGRLGAAFNGPIGGCAAKPPWAWNDPRDERVGAGEWFLNPIEAIGSHFRIPGLGHRYLYNPYFLGESITATPADCRQSEASETVGQSAVQTAMGIGRVLMSGGIDRGNIGRQAKELFLKEITLLEWSRPSEMEQWEYLDESGERVSTEKIFRRMNFTSLSIDGMITLNSPVVSAPQRFFRSLIMRYRVDHPLKLTLHWQNADQDSLPEGKQEKTYQLPAAREWSIFKMELSNTADWQSEQTASRFQAKIIPVSSRQSAELDIKYLVLDRTAMADELRLREP